MTRIVLELEGGTESPPTVSQFTVLPTSLQDQGIDPDRTPLGVRVVPGGATVRVWAPNAQAVSIRGTFNDWEETPLERESGGNHWSMFIPRMKPGDQYKLFVRGHGFQGVPGWKRDPAAREITPNVDDPDSEWNCIVADPSPFPWHDASYWPPAFNDLIIYQFHIGAYFDGGQPGADRRDERPCRFLDVLFKIPYLVELGINAIQPLPIAEFPEENSLGYNGTDYFAPEMAYYVPPDAPDFERYVEQANALLRAKQQPEYAPGTLRSQTNQLRALVDICHVYGLAVILDVVYNHAGGPFGSPEFAQNTYFFDRQEPGDPVDNNRSLYFTDHGHAGGLVFAFWNGDVRQSLIDNARFFYDEYHVDGYRFDQVTVIKYDGGEAGVQFYRDLTDTLHYHKPEGILIAEFWDSDKRHIVSPTREGGGGFDAVWYDGLRDALRAVIGQAAAGAGGRLDLDSVRDQLGVKIRNAWQAVQHIENHDEHWRQRTGGPLPRVPRLADGNDARSWWARSRSRVAAGILMTAPGIPMLFMGQEFLEDKPWTDDGQNHPGCGIYWDGLGRDRAMDDYLRFMQELIALRKRLPALRSESIHPYYVHNDNRVLAYHRWIEGQGDDVVIVASLRETTYGNYRLGLPQAGRWNEVFNSDVYDNFVNPRLAGNGGSIWAENEPRDGFAASAEIVIPANSVLIFARQ